jgi:hypothetical protein
MPSLLDHIAVRRQLIYNMYLQICNWQISSLKLKFGSIIDYIYSNSMSLIHLEFEGVLRPILTHIHIYIYESHQGKDVFILNLPVRNTLVLFGPFSSLNIMMRSSPARSREKKHNTACTVIQV